MLLGLAIVSSKPVFEVKISKKRVISIPKAVADMLGIVEGMKLKVYVEDNKIILEPVREALWYAIYGPKIGLISFKEIEEESIFEQEKLSVTS
jgi:AbrB family looped-hinge helix DNA binding protein